MEACFIYPLHKLSSREYQNIFSQQNANSLFTNFGKIDSKKLHCENNDSCHKQETNKKRCERKVSLDAHEKLKNYALN